MDKNSENFDKDAYLWVMNSELGYDIWDKKYRYDNEPFSEWLNRISNGNQKIASLVKQRKFLFGGRTLSNRGTDKEGSYSNCYSQGFVQDSLNDILDTNTKIAMTFKAQGGEGLSLSKIRPKGTPINKFYLSDGIVPFMNMFNTTTDSISQGGSRKGALMMSLDVWHKEISTFVTIKSNPDAITKANLSVEIDDDFMRRIGTNEHIKHIVCDYSGHVIEYDVDVDKVYNLICKNAHDTAEPGILFTNRFRNYNMMEFVPEYQIETSNPCGEQPLPKHGACNLSSINLSAYVENPYTNMCEFDYDSLKEDLNEYVIAMDDVLTENANKHALKEQRNMALRYRNIGIGVMGLADMFVMMGIKYGDEKSKEFVSDLSRFMFRESVLASVRLAKTRGNFPGYSDEFWDATIFKENFSIDEINSLKNDAYMRNCSLLSIAPTGSIGTMLGISTGVEPFFALSFNRKTISLNNNEEKLYTVDIDALKNYKTINNTDIVPEYFVSAYDIKWNDRIDIQAAFQKSIDTAISSTLNLPKATSIDDIKSLYKYAWEKGLKGVTIYVDGSREPILSVGNSADTTKQSVDFKKRPKSIEAEAFPVKVKGEQFAVIVGYIEGKPYETFAIRTETPIYQHKGIVAKKSKGVYSFKSEIMALDNILDTNINIEEKSATLYISMLLRHNVPLKYIIKTAKKANPSISSFTSAICRILSKFVDTEVTEDKCPLCGGKMIKEGGCVHCENGDYSKCGD